MSEASRTVMTDTTSLDTYEFIVLKMTTPEDLDLDGNQQKLEVKIMYRFKFQMDNDRKPSLYLSRDQ